VRQRFALSEHSFRAQPTSASGVGVLWEPLREPLGVNSASDIAHLRVGNAASTSRERGGLAPSAETANDAVWESVMPELGWALELVHDDPGPALVRRSAEATLLVVGTHEHVGLARLTSGSVSRYCLSHAVCPTVIVPVNNREVDKDGVASNETERPTAATTGSS